MKQSGKKKLRLSIKLKTIAMIIIFAAALSAISMVVSGRVLSNVSDELYYQDAEELSETLAQTIDAECFERVKNAVKAIYDSTEDFSFFDEVDPEDPDYEAKTAENEEKIEAYFARYDVVSESDDFKALLDQLRRVQEVNSVDCLYVSYIDKATETFVYVCDAALEDACAPGTFDPIFDVNKGLLEDPTIGMPPYETDYGDYGALLTAGATVYNAKKEVVGYTMVDISLKEMRNRQIDYVMRLLVFQAITVIVLCIIGAVFVDFVLIKPIKRLSAAADSYCDDKSSTDRHTFAVLKIKTGDEIEALSDSMKQMESDLNEHIKNLLTVNNELVVSQTLASEMTVLANKDALTGVRNRHAYDAEVAALQSRLAAGTTSAFGLAVIDLNYLKQINDTYGHEAGNDALVALCKAVCGVFVHSPVFRIGGDEFVVLLENNDYDKWEELVKEFNEQLALLTNDTELPPQKRISAAIGCAIYDKKIDASVDDVFRRADQTMYENKRAMKAVRQI